MPALNNTTVNVSCIQLMVPTFLTTETFFLTDILLFREIALFTKALSSDSNFSNSALFTKIEAHEVQWNFNSASTLQSPHFHWTDCQIRRSLNDIGIRKSKVKWMPRHSSGGHQNKAPLTGVTAHSFVSKWMEWQFRNGFVMHAERSLIYAWFELKDRSLCLTSNIPR